MSQSGVEKLFGMVAEAGEDPVDLAMKRRDRQTIDGHVAKARTDGLTTGVNLGATLGFAGHVVKRWF